MELFMGKSWENHFQMVDVPLPSLLIEAWKNPEENMGDVLWKNKNNGANAWKNRFV